LLIIAASPLLTATSLLATTTTHTTWFINLVWATALALRKGAISSILTC